MPEHTRRRTLAGSSVTTHAPGWQDRPRSSRALHRIGEITAYSASGATAALLVVAWGVVGLATGFPDWWATALYGFSAAITFVMVFVIQHTNERQTSAMQRKLDELIRATAQADSSLIAVEEAPDDHLLTLADQSAAEGQARRD